MTQNSDSPTRVFLVPEPAHPLREPAAIARDLLRIQICLERLRRDLYEARAEARTQRIIAGLAIEESDALREAGRLAREGGEQDGT